MYVLFYPQLAGGSVALPIPTKQLDTDEPETTKSIILKVEAKKPLLHNQTSCSTRLQRAVMKSTEIS